MSSRLNAEFTDKYEKTGKIGNILIQNFFKNVEYLFKSAIKPGMSVAEIGCGAGYSTLRITDWLPDNTNFSASDVSESLVAEAKERNPDISITQQSVYSLDMDDKSVDILIMMEVLEHLEHPQKALAELSRVARSHVIISTPREPIWRILNMSRGKYLKNLGNTPGHIQHWSSRKLQQEASTFFQVIDMRQPLPWTVLLLKPLH